MKKRKKKGNVIFKYYILLILFKILNINISNITYKTGIQIFQNLAWTRMKKYVYIVI